jgi:hypothetical protein
MPCRGCYGPPDGVIGQERAMNAAAFGFAIKAAGGPQVPATQDPNVILSWLKDLFRHVRLAWELFFDPRVPWMTKIIPPLAIAYVLSPIDIIPDGALGLGQLDDLAVDILRVAGPTQQEGGLVTLGQALDVIHQPSRRTEPDDQQEQGKRPRQREIEEDEGHGERGDHQGESGPQPLAGGL